MTEFKREDRYIVIKKSDLDQHAHQALDRQLYIHQIRTREAVVIESDWPIYEQVWDMVQRMAEGRPQRSDELAEYVGRLRKHLQSAIYRLDDMLMGDDGQAWKEAERARPAMQKVLDEGSQSGN